MEHMLLMYLKRTCYTDLFVRHIQSNNIALLSDKFTDHVAVLSRPAPKIKYICSFKTLGDNSSTAIISEMLDNLQLCIFQNTLILILNSTCRSR